MKEWARLLILARTWLGIGLGSLALLVIAYLLLLAHPVSLFGLGFLAIVAVFVVAYSYAGFVIWYFSRADIRQLFNDE